MKLVKKIEITRREIDDSHYYWVDGEFVPGVTRIIDEAGPVAYGLKQFFLRSTPESAEETLRTTGDFGARMHDAYEALGNGEELNLAEDYPRIKAKKHIMSFVNWFQEFKPNIGSIRTEYTVASKKFKYAGTLDFMCTKGRGIWLVDYKSGGGIYYPHELQIAAYKQAVQEMYGIRVHHTAILRTGSKHKAGFEFKEVNKPFKAFQNVYRSYLDLHGGKIPAPPEIDVYPETVRILK